MIVDYSQTTIVPGVTLFSPDFVPITQPTDPDDIGETFVIRGTNTGVTTSVGGTPDNVEF